ncbi:MAG: hypothetical protein LQ352_002351 [Teloschistes flavicans]|nr:MAG: hypothetical protein LQ352_002351 [Teloschistes flavicans]
MNSFAGDDDDVDSGALSPNASSDNDPDIEMDGDGDAEGDTYGDVDNNDDNEDDDDGLDEQDNEDSQGPFGDHTGRRLFKDSDPSVQNETTSSTQDRRAPAATVPTAHLSVRLTTPSPPRTPSATNGFVAEPLQVRPEALTASVYDIVPTIAAPHSTSINSITATPDLRWVFSGGADGYIRRFNWIETVNGKSMLTVAQRHPFVDSVTKAGVLVSYWENEDPQAKATAGEDGPYLSSVYSLAVQRHGIWLLSGLENGGINLQSVRHDEGKQIACLRQHTSAISVLNLAQDEQSVLSGSWDKSVIDWDLNTGQVKRKFEGSGGQISALEIRPTSNVPVPEVSGEAIQNSDTFSSNGVEKPPSNGALTNGMDHESTTEPVDESGMADAPGSPADSLFGGNDSLFGDNDDAETAAPSAGHFVDDDDNEFSRAIANGISGQDCVDASGDNDMIVNASSMDVKNLDKDAGSAQPPINDGIDPSVANGQGDAALTLTNSPHAEEIPPKPTGAENMSLSTGLESQGDNTFLAASIDGSLRIWDKRRPNPIAKIPPRNVPPWCMNACWSPDGNCIYAGRRNGTVEEFCVHRGLQGVERSFKLPYGSGPVSAVRAMPNGRHLICASYDILRLYDLEQQQTFKHSTVPFLIVPGHRTGVVSHLYMDPTCRYMISTAGTRGWEGNSTEVLLGYEIGCGR